MAASSTVALREGDHQAMSLSAKVNRIIRDYGRGETQVCLLRLQLLGYRHH